MANIVEDQLNEIERKFLAGGVSSLLWSEVKGMIAALRDSQHAMARTIVDGRCSMCGMAEMICRGDCKPLLYRTQELLRVALNHANDAATTRDGIIDALLAVDEGRHVYHRNNCWTQEANGENYNCNCDIKQREWDQRRKFDAAKALLDKAKADRRAL